MAWKIMFPRIKPFFAIKCNPDTMVSHVLGRTYYMDGNTADDDNDSDSTTTAAAAAITGNTTNNVTNDICGFDCASLAEIQLALQCSHSNNNNNHNDIIQQCRRITKSERCIKLIGRKEKNNNNIAVIITVNSSCATT